MWDQWIQAYLETLVGAVITSPTLSYLVQSSQETSAQIWSKLRQVRCIQGSVSATECKIDFYVTQRIKMVQKSKFYSIYIYIYGWCYGQVDQPSNSLLSRKRYFKNFSFNFNGKNFILIVVVHKSTLNIAVIFHSEICNRVLIF